MKNILKKSLFIFALLLLSNSMVLSMDKIIFLDKVNKVTPTTSLGTYLNTSFMSAATGSLALATGFCYLWFSSFAKFSAFDQWLIDTSTKTKNYQSFSNWRIHWYQTAENLVKKQNEVRQQLDKDIQNPNNKYFTNKKGYKINLQNAQEQNNKPSGILFQEFKKEKKYLEYQLEYLSKFTPFANILRENLRSLSPLSKMSNKQANNGVLMQCTDIISKLNTDTLHTLENLIKSIKKSLTINNDLERYFFYRPPMYYTIANTKQEKEAEIAITIKPKAYSKNPLTWKIGNSNKATKLYCEALKRYIWLLTLERIIMYDAI